jgi:hypothetical protein
MAQKEVDLDLWRDLYETASQVQGLAPWAWMEEIDVFGVEMPGDAGLIFVSVMGAIGAHYSVAVYPGVAALTALWALHHDKHASPEQVLEIPQVQLSFENRKLLERKDLQIIKQLGLTFRGQNAWPRFRGYRPGFAPWFLEKDEAATLLAALRQLLDVAPRLQVDPSPVRANDPQTYLVRALKTDTKGGAWADEFRNIPPVSVSIPRVLPDADAVRQCHALPKVENGIEVDFFLVPTRIGDGKARPLFPYSLLMVESISGSVVGQEMLVAENSLNDMLSSIPAKLIDRFKEFGIRPQWLAVRPGRLADIVRPTCEALGIELRIREKLSRLDPARKGMLEFLSRG